jgi:mono/diheme cytochrome c family protein
MPAPSWAQEVSPIVTRTCVGCHGPGGIEATRPYGTWAQVSANKQGVLAQIYACRMPQPDAGVSLSEADRAVLLHWFVCGAPNN